MMKFCWRRKRELVALSIITILALFFRLYRLDAIPLGLHYDEAANGIDALGVLQGIHPIFFEANSGREPLFIYLVAASIGLLGRNPLAIRVVSAIIGTATIPVTYFLVKELFSKVSDSPRRLALLSSLWLALSYWHINFSRIGYRGILLPLLSSLSFYFLWRGWNLPPQGKGRLLSFALSGVSLGLSLYTYIPSRFLPLFLLSFAGCLSIASSKERRWRSEFRAILLVILVALLIFSPLGYYFLRHFDAFVQSARNVSVFNPLWNQGGVPRTLARNILQTLGMFVIKGDPNWRHNPAQRPAFNPFTASFFLLGLCIALHNYKRGPYLFTMLWMVVMSFPAILTASGMPHSLRSIGMLPAVYIFPAIGTEAVWGWLRERRSLPTVAHLFWLGLSLLFIVVGAFTYPDYFTPWGERLELQGAFDVVFVNAARAISESDEEDGVWILPVSTLTDPGTGHYVVDFLCRGRAPYRFIRMDESTAAEELSLFCQGRKQVWLIEWLEPILWEAYHYYADPKGLASFLFSKYGRQVEKREFEGFDVGTYELPPSPYFAIADSFEPLSINFGNQIELTGVSYGGSSLYETSTPSEVEKKVLPSGKSGWVVLRWQALRQASKNYKVGVYLVDEEGYLVGQMDKLLLSNYLQPTSQWEPDQIEMDYYTLPSLPATPPGEYHIEVAVYDPESLERLPILGQMGGHQAFTIGTLQIVKPLLPPEVEPQVWLGEKIAPGVRLLGYDLPGERVEPGGEIALTLYWEALEDVANDYLFSLQLRDGEGKVWGEKVGRPVDGRYPTTEWDEGEVVRDWHDIPLEAEAPSGDYAIHLGVLEGNRIVGEADLSTLEVWGRAHSFVVPEMGYSLEAILGEEIKLLGYDLSPEVVKPGEALLLTLYWQALGKMERSYTVFVHLLDARNQIWGQKDTIPGGGAMPTTGWVEGEVITDRYEVMIMPEALAGRYLLECGIYLAETGERLPVFDMAEESLGDRLLLPIEIEVNP